MIAHGLQAGCDRLHDDNPDMDIDAATELLGGLSPARFMRRHWQKAPLLVRQAWPGVQAPMSRGGLFALAAQDDVESRLLTQVGDRWRLRHGPLPRSALPPLKQPGWTLLVQGLDLHSDAAFAMRQRFAFAGQARLDDVMVSYASDGGGVGPHLDAYDVFLLQLQGTRRWRVGRVRDKRLVDDAPVKRLRHFEPEFDWLLAPGDMLYVPPGWGHDGVAVGPCMTASIGFRAPRRSDLARDLLAQLADDIDTPDGEPPLRDRPAQASATPGRVPMALRDAAQAAVARAVSEHYALDRAIGQQLSEPKPQVWFDAGLALSSARVGLCLDRRSRMLYDDRHLFINGEAFVCGGKDAALLRQLADTGALPGRAAAGLSRQAWAQLSDWAQAGWLHAQQDEG